MSGANATTITISSLPADCRPFADVDTCSYPIEKENTKQDELAIECATRNVVRERCRSVLMRDQLQYKTKGSDGRVEVKQTYRSLLVTGRGTLIDIDAEEGRQQHRVLIDPRLHAHLSDEVRRAGACSFYENFRKKQPEESHYPMMRFAYEIDAVQLKRADGGVCQRNASVASRDECDRRVLAALDAFVDSLKPSTNTSTVKLHKIVTSESPKFDGDSGALEKMSVHGTVHLRDDATDVELLFADVGVVGSLSEAFRIFCLQSSQFGINGAESMFICQKPPSNADRTHCLCQAGQQASDALTFLFDEKIYKDNGAYRLFGCAKIDQRQRVLHDARRYTAASTTSTPRKWTYTPIENQLTALVETMATQPFSARPELTMATNSVLAISGVQTKSADGNRKRAQNQKKGGTVRKRAKTVTDTIVLTAANEKEPQTRREVLEALCNGVGSALPRNASEWLRCVRSVLARDFSSPSITFAGLVALGDAAISKLSSSNNETVIDAYWKAIEALLDTCDDEERALAQRLLNMDVTCHVSTVAANILQRQHENAENSATGVSATNPEHRRLRELVSNTTSGVTLRSTVAITQRVDDTFLSQCPPCVRNALNAHLRAAPNTGIKHGQRKLAVWFLYKIGLSDASIDEFVREGSSKEESRVSLQGMVRSYKPEYNLPSCRQIGERTEYVGLCPYDGSTKQRKDQCHKECTEALCSGDNSVTDIEDLVGNSASWGCMRYAGARFDFQNK